VLYPVSLCLPPKPRTQVPMTPPTLAMSFGANDGPLGGRSGGVFVNANQVKARLLKEVENNVTLLMRQNSTDTDQLEVCGGVASSLSLSAVLATVVSSWA